MKFLSYFMMFMLPPTMMTSMYMLLKSTFISLEIPFMTYNMTFMKISLILDWISCLFSCTVMFITAMILMYSMHYIPEPEHNKFMLTMVMFVLSMIMLILSNNMIFMLLGWDGLGLTSYMLVIFYQNPTSSSSGSITILSNRIGDALIIMSIAMMFMSSSWEFFMIKMENNMMITMLMMAACTKSAQFPFSAWLPAAMAAPTPISALVHSSTLVTAGVFLMIRITEYAQYQILTVLLIISSSTAIYASMTACWEQDMKKIIAYSTLSQIAMMMFAVSMMSPNLAFFHLITHALFKSMMFMTAGVIIMGSSYQDMRHMGSMIKNFPMISTIMGVSMMALMGMPFMSGFFSKDMMLEMMLKSNLIQLMSFIMIMSIAMTASYSLRLMKNTFKMIMKSKPENTMSSINMMELPLMIMSPMSITIGAMMMWMCFPTQLFIMPYTLKLSIIASLTMGILLSTNMSFSSIKYMKLGVAALSIWFSHSLSTLSFNHPQMTASLIMKYDKTWQEMYGPKSTYNLYKTYMTKKLQILESPMFIMLALTIPTTMIMVMM